MKRGKVFKRWLRKAVEGVVGPTDLRRVVVGVIGFFVLSVAVFALMRADGGGYAVDDWNGSVGGELKKSLEERMVGGGSGMRKSGIVNESVSGRKMESVDSDRRKTRPVPDLLSVREKVVAVMVANYGYRELAMNTICALKRVGITTYVLLAIDEKMHQFAIERKVSSIQLPRGKDAGDGDGKSDNDASSFTAESERLEDAVSFGSDAFVKVSLKKTVAVLSLLKKGVEVLFVDVDVTLKRNPIPILSAYPEDIIATSDIMFDKDEPKNINYRLNSGLFLVRPTPQVIEAFEQMVRLGLRSGRSQQKAFNWVLCGQYGGLERGRGALVGTNGCVWRGRVGNVTTRVLPLEQFPNGSGWSYDKAVAIHQNHIQGVEEKIQAIRDNNGWFYNDRHENFCQRDE